MALRPVAARRTISLAGTCAGLLVLAPGVLAQQSGQQERAVQRSIDQITSESEQFRVDTSLGISERSVLDFGGFASFGFLNLTEGDGNARRLLQPELSLYGRAVIDGTHTFFTRARFQYRDYSRGDSFDDQGDSWTEPFLDRYWYEFDLAGAFHAYQGRAIDGDFRLRVGRQFVDWGQGLVYSDTLYAGLATTTVGAFSFDALIAQTPTDESITDWDASRSQYQTDTDRAYLGGLLRCDVTSTHQVYGYALWEFDNDPTFQRPAVPIGVPVRFKYDAVYFGVGAQGSITTNLLYGAEFVYETGKSFSDPLQGTQMRETINAYAGRFILTYLFQDRSQTRLQFETLFASGDSDRNVTSDTVGGNQPGTDDNAFNGLGFVNTGLAFSPVFSNLFLVRGGVSTIPFVSVEGLEQLQVGMDLFVFAKLSAEGAIEEPTNDDSFLGGEVDFSVNYRLTSDLAVSGRYGVFFPGDAIIEDDIRQFFFAGITLSF